MTEFIPFDDQFKFDESVLTESFPDYILGSILNWMKLVIQDRKAGAWVGGEYQYSNKDIVLPLSRALRKSLPNENHAFWSAITEDIPTFRNVLSFFLQKLAYSNRAAELEDILRSTSSAYAVDSTKKTVNGIVQTQHKLAYRVSAITRKQASSVLADQQLIAEAWESYYGIEPNDELTETRVTDALAGLFRDKYFPGEQRTQFGTMLHKMRQSPDKYPLPAKTLFDQDRFLELMKDFSVIRGNHKTGTGRAPTHEEAGFVLHFGIMLFQLLGK